MTAGEIVFVEGGGVADLKEMADAEFVIGVYPDGHGHVIKSRDHAADDARSLTPECVEWLRANPTNRPEDFEEE